MKATYEYTRDCSEFLCEERNVRIYRLSEPFNWQMTEEDEPFQTDYILTIAGYSSKLFEEFVMALPSDKQGNFLLFASYPEYLLRDCIDAEQLLDMMGIEVVAEDVPDPTVFDW